MNIFPIIIFVYNLKHIFPQCVLRFKDDSIKQTLVRRLNSIYNQKYSTLAGSNMGDVKYQYKICDCPSEEIKHLNSSVIQYQLTDNKWGSNKLIGSHLEMDIDGGDNWFLITYYEGDPYLDMCLGSKRKAKIIILCDTTVKKPTFKFLYEFKNMINISPIQNKEAKIPDCGYVFELRLWEDSFCVDDKNPSHSNPGKRRHQGKSTGSILSILFFTFFGVYLTFGTLYRKFILGVGNGIDILPNLDFWRNFLELQAVNYKYFVNIMSYCDIDCMRIPNFSILNHLLRGF
ncbi:unnamed protein product [Gordionus sp. m RMFG-2023]